MFNQQYWSQFFNILESPRTDFNCIFGVNCSTTQKLGLSDVTLHLMHTMQKNDYTSILYNMYKLINKINIYMSNKTNFHCKIIA